MPRRFAGGRLIIASHNPGKVAEIADLLRPFDADIVSAGELGLAEPAEDGDSFTANAIIKARAAARAAELPALAEDSGLAVAALDGQPVDRTPVCNPTSVATVELMDLVDAPFPDANRQAEPMARLAATAHTILGFDTVMPVFSIIQESSALGCKMQWEGKDNWPTVRMSEPIWEHPDDIYVPNDLSEHPDTKCVLDAIKLLREELGPDVAIIGKTMGPWTLAYHVFGVEHFLLMTVDDPDMVKRSLHKMKEISVLFGEAQIAAGADVLTFPDHATGDLVSGAYYRDFLMELHQEMAERLKVPLILHICGSTADRLDYIARSGMACFHFDSKNDPQEVVDIAAGRIRLVGNLNNPEIGRAHV